MCGRFVSSSTPDELARYFDAEPAAEAAVEPRYNVAPTTDVLVVVEGDEARELALHHWGLVPRWAKSPAIGNKMINARAEGLAEKNAFKSAFKRKRCIVPVDGFYEWKKLPGQKTKQPYFIQRADGEPLAFAGLWEQWRDPDNPEGGVLRSTTIITTEANAFMAEIHDRMPVVLPPSAWATWLDPANDDLDALSALLVPAPDDLLVMHPVSSDVGNVRNQGPHLIEEVEPAPTITEPGLPGLGG